MKIKLDENLSRYLKSDPSRYGHDAETTADENLLGKPDIDVAATANADARMVFTLDVAIADLRKFRPGEHSGIVLAVNRFIPDFVNPQNLESSIHSIVNVEPNRIRIRRPTS